MIKDHARWIILLSASLILFANWYNFNIPSAIKESLQLKFSDQFSPEEFEYFFSLFFSIYALPNIILPFLNGHLIDKIGHGKVLVPLTALIALGQIVCTYASSHQSPTAMIIGRFLLGTGSESLVVAGLTLIMKYFHGKELALAIGASISFSGLGSTLSLILTPRLSASYGVDTAVRAGALLSIVALVFSFLVLYIDHTLEQENESGNEAHDYQAQNAQTSLFTGFTKAFWFLAIASLFFKSSFNGWNNIGVSFLIEYWYQDIPIDEAQILAGGYISLVWLMPVVSSPFAGYFMDKYGHRTKVLAFGALLLTITFIIMLFVHPLLPMLLLGFAFSIAGVAVFSLISHFLPRELVGKGTGIINSSVNIGASVFPPIVAALRVNSGHYYYSQIFLIIASLVANVFAHLTRMESEKESNDSQGKNREESELLELKKCQD